MSANPRLPSEELVEPASITSRPILLMLLMMLMMVVVMLMTMMVVVMLMIVVVMLMTMIVVVVMTIVTVTIIMFNGHLNVGLHHHLVRFENVCRAKSKDHHCSRFCGPGKKY